MSRGVQWSLFGSVVVAALIALAGCSHYYWSGERAPWRREAEVACLNSGAVSESPERVRIAAISGPGMCGMDFPLRVSALGDGAPLGYDDEPLRPPGAIPDASLPPHWPVIQSTALAPLQGNVPPGGALQTGPTQGSPVPAAAPQAAAPLSLDPQGIPEPDEGEADFAPAPPHSYDGAPRAPAAQPPATAYPPPTDQPRAEPVPAAPEQQIPLGPPTVTGTVGPVEVKPPATLACPIVSALDRWISAAVQPAALRWFQQPVVEIKQISAYSCRGMNGNSNAHISEHAFGNALDIAEFVLADGRKITVQYGWRGSPEEQGFLHDVQLAACNEFSTVLAPGANIYHYNHIHVDLMRRPSGRRICEPEAIPGEIVAERARARYAAQHYGDPGTTGSIARRIKRALGYSGEDDDKLPLAVPGED